MSVDILCPGLQDRRAVAARWRGGGVVEGRRGAGEVTAIILHQTAGNTFTTGNQARWLRDCPGSVHSVDGIRANFVVLMDGTVLYTHDVEVRVQSVGGFVGPGVDIEFACHLPHGRQPPSDPARRLTVAAIRAGRNLVSGLCLRLRSIHYIHPHGQVQTALMDGQACGEDTGVICGKLDSCPGPDIWVNVGTWAARELDLLTTPIHPFQNNGISPLMGNTAYRQAVRDRGPRMPCPP